MADMMDDFMYGGLADDDDYQYEDEEDQLDEDLIDLEARTLANSEALEKMSQLSKTNYPLKVRISRNIGNRDYPLTKYEKTRAIARRAKILEKTLGQTIDLPIDIQRQIDTLQEKYKDAFTSDEEKVHIEKEIIDLQDSVYSQSMALKREDIYLTDEELETESQDVPPGLDKYHPIRIAMLEYRFRKLPMTITREFPDGTTITKPINDFLIIEDRGLLVEANNALPEFRLPEAF